MEYSNFGSDRESSRNPGISTPSQVMSRASSLFSSMPGQSSNDVYAEVVDVVYNKKSKHYESNLDIGKIKIRYHGVAATSDKTTEDNQSNNFAYPLWSCINQYPIKGETVCILAFRKINYYFPSSINILQNVNNNSTLGLSVLPIIPSSDQTVESYKTNSSANSNTKRNRTTSSVPLGDTFKDRSYIPMLAPNEGDFIISGRFGNYIRFGNNPLTNSPNIKISVFSNISKTLTNSHITEEKYVSSTKGINNSYMWFTSDEVIDLNTAITGKSIFLKSYNKKTSDYNKSQIIVSSERIIFNATLSDLLFFSGGGIALNTNQLIAIDAGNDVNISSSTNFNVNSNKINIVSNKINLGDVDGVGSLQPLVLGDELVKLLGDLIDEIVQITVANGAGKTGFPLNATKLLSLKRNFRTLLSKTSKTK